MDTAESKKIKSETGHASQKLGYVTAKTFTFKCLEVFWFTEMMKYHKLHLQKTPILNVDQIVLAFYAFFLRSH